MVDKVQKIREEVERRLRLLVPKMTFQHQRKELENILSFIDFLQEEPVSEKLKEAAKEYSGKSSHPLNNAFMSGAKWQKRQMMKDAVDGEIFCAVAYPHQPKAVSKPISGGYKFGDKVKLLIIKED